MVVLIMKRDETAITEKRQASAHNDSCDMECTIYTELVQNSKVAHHTGPLITLNLQNLSFSSSTVHTNHTEEYTVKPPNSAKLCHPDPS